MYSLDGFVVLCMIEYLTFRLVCWLSVCSRFEWWFNRSGFAICSFWVLSVCEGFLVLRFVFCFCFDWCLCLVLRSLFVFGLLIGFC